jgi:non-reducing end alpha-L-arabinofuranosidase
LNASAGVGATVLSTANVTGFSKGQTISIGDGASSETAIVSSVRSRGGASITLVAPLARAHAAGEEISGSGIGLTAPLTRTHASGAQVSDNVPTPGAANQYHAANH